MCKTMLNYTVYYELQRKNIFKNLAKVLKLKIYLTFAVLTETKSDTNFHSKEMEYVKKDQYFFFL